MFDIRQTADDRLELVGRFDAAVAPQAQAVLDGVQTSCEIDCSQLAYISSAGLGVLLATYKRLDAAGHTIKLKNMRKLVRDVFRYSRMDTIFEVD